VDLTTMKVAHTIEVPTPATRKVIRVLPDRKLAYVSCEPKVEKFAVISLSTGK